MSAIMSTSKYAENISLRANINRMPICIATVFRIELKTYRNTDRHSIRIYIPLLSVIHVRRLVHSGIVRESTDAIQAFVLHKPGLRRALCGSTRIELCVRYG